MSPRRGATEIIPEPIMRLMERESAGEKLSARDTKSLDDFWDSMSPEDLDLLDAEAAIYAEEGEQADG